MAIIKNNILIVRNVTFCLGGSTLYLGTAFAASGQDGLICSIEATLKYGQNASLKGFGNFEVNERADCKDSDPQTGTEITITSLRKKRCMPEKVATNKVCDLYGLLMKAAGFERKVRKFCRFWFLVFGFWFLV